MALNANIVWEVRTGGSDSNGGGFKTGASGTDRSQQNGAFASLTTLSVVNATTTKVTVSLTDYTVVTADVGNVLQVTGGSATAGFYEITAVDTVANTWTVDRSLGTAGQTVVGAMGGALLSPAKIGAVAVGGNILYLKNDGSVFSITSASTNVSQGCFSPSNDVLLIGYGSTRTPTNTDSAPTLQLNVSTATMFTVNAVIDVINVICDGNSQTSAKLTSGGRFIRCLFKNFNTASSGASHFVQCSATTNSAAVLAGSADGCEAYANTGTPFSVGSGQTATNCLSYSNTGGSTDGFTIGNNAHAAHCTAYGNGRDGFRLTASHGSCESCYAEANTGTGFNETGTAGLGYLQLCAALSNSGGNKSTTLQSVGFLTLTASAFTSVGGNDFSLNNTSGGGASLRAAGYPGTFPRGTTIGYLDVGAAQHADPASHAGRVLSSSTIAGVLA